MATAPGKVTNLTATRAVIKYGGVDTPEDTLIWNAPVSDGGSPITKYYVYASFNNQPWTLYSQLNPIDADAYSIVYGSDLLHTVTRYRISAVNAIGIGEYVAACTDYPGSGDCSKQSAPSNLNNLLMPEISVRIVSEADETVELAGTVSMQTGLGIVSKAEGDVVSELIDGLNHLQYTARMRRGVVRITISGSGITEKTVTQIHLSKETVTIPVTVT